MLRISSCTVSCQPVKSRFRSDELAAFCPRFHFPATSLDDAHAVHQPAGPHVVVHEMLAGTHPDRRNRTHETPRQPFDRHHATPRDVAGEARRLCAEQTRCVSTSECRRRRSTSHRPPIRDRSSLPRHRESVGTTHSAHSDADARSAVRVRGRPARPSDRRGARASMESRTSRPRRPRARSSK